MMNSFSIRTFLEKDAEVHLTGLPFQKGDRVEVIVTLLDNAEARDQALHRFTDRAKQSKFRSDGPYPTRDELHERH